MKYLGNGFTNIPSHSLTFSGEHAIACDTLHRRLALDGKDQMPRNDRLQLIAQFRAFKYARSTAPNTCSGRAVLA